MTPPTGGLSVGTAHASIVLDTSGLTRGVAQVGAAARQLETGLGNLRNIANLTFAGFAASQIAQSVVQMEQLGTQIRRTTVALESMVGGGANTAAIIAAIQEASGGAIDNLTAMQVALARDGARSCGYDRRISTADTSRTRRDARSVRSSKMCRARLPNWPWRQANLSFRRLDQLGLSVTEVKNRMAELQRANTELEDSQAFLAASIDVLLTKYGPLLSSTEAQATSFERLAVASRDAAGRIAEAASEALNFAAAPLARVILGPTQQQQLEETAILLRDLERQQRDLASRGMAPAAWRKQCRCSGRRESHRSVESGDPGRHSRRRTIARYADHGGA